MQKSQIESVFIKDKDTENTVVMVALRSLNGEGRYLVVASLQEGRIVVSHQCKATLNQKKCWHVETAVEVLKDLYWFRKELDTAEVISIHQMAKLTQEWRQIPYLEQLATGRR